MRLVGETTTHKSITPVGDYERPVECGLFYIYDTIHITYRRQYGSAKEVEGTAKQGNRPSA
jgi:hypothetical protein